MVCFVMDIQIVGTGSYVGEEVVRNEDLEKRIRNYDYERNPGKSFAQWVEDVTGIQERRYSSLPMEEMALSALQRSLDFAGLTGEDLDAVIFNTLSAASKCPHPAHVLAERIGNGKAHAVSLNYACSGAVFGLHQAYLLLREEEYSRVAVVSADKLSALLDYDDPKSAILFGDGAGALIIQKGGDGLLSKPFVGHEYSKNICINRVISMKGESVFKEAVRKMLMSGEEVLKRSGVSREEIDYFIPHPANQRIIDLVAEKLGMRDRMLSNLQKEGNLSGAGVLRVFDQAVRDGRITRGDLVLFSCVAGSYCYGACLVKY